MTVDMLAATFFWPEGTLLGVQALPPDADPETPRGDAVEGADGAPEDGFWATVARNLWRSGAAPSTTTVP